MNYFFVGRRGGQAYKYVFFPDADLFFTVHFRHPWVLYHKKDRPSTPQSLFFRGIAEYYIAVLLFVAFDYAEGFFIVRIFRDNYV